MDSQQARDGTITALVATGTRGAQGAHGDPGHRGRGRMAAAELTAETKT